MNNDARLQLHPPPGVMHDITRPTLVLDQDRAARNIARMAERARRFGLHFRPHFKTHQAAALGELFRAEGVTGITVSSVDMARYFARHGWLDITIAFPVNLRELEIIDALAADVKLGLLVESPEVVAHLDQQITHPVQVWIEMDAGYGRTGVPWDQGQQVVELARQIAAAEALKFAGLLSHTGQTYHADSAQDVRRIHTEARQRLLTVRDAVLAAGFDTCPVSLGDTPACSLADDWEGVDEIRPGNFVFYDLMQLQMGACQAEDIAVAVACPVVAKYPERHEAVVYGGAVHLSREALTNAQGNAVFGYAAPWQDGAWGPPVPGAALVSLSQEHGILHVVDEFMHQIKIGQLVLILPVHSCLTADLYDSYCSLTGERITRLQSNIDPGMVS